MPRRNAARAMRAVSSGTDGSGCDGSNMGGLQGGNQPNAAAGPNAPDFANSVRTFDEVKHTYCRKAVYATSASLLMRRVTTTPFSSH